MMTLPGPATASITTAPALSVVVPAYNEEAGIAACVEQLRAALQALAASWEIVVADDGSRDRTADIVRDLAAADPRVRLLALPHRGKGATVFIGTDGEPTTGQVVDVPKLIDTVTEMNRTRGLTIHLVIFDPFSAEQMKRLATNNGGHGALLSPPPPGLTGLIGELLNDPPGFDRAALLPEVNRKTTAFFSAHLLP